MNHTPITAFSIPRHEAKSSPWHQGESRFFLVHVARTQNSQTRRARRIETWQTWHLDASITGAPCGEALQSSGPLDNDLWIGLAARGFIRAQKRRCIYFQALGHDFVFCDLSLCFFLSPIAPNRHSTNRTETSVPLLTGRTSPDCRFGSSTLHQRDSRNDLFKGYTGAGADTRRSNGTGNGLGYGYPGGNGSSSGGSHLAVENKGFRPATPNSRFV